MFEKNNKMTFIDLFAGIGGFHIAFIMLVPLVHLLLNGMKMQEKLMNLIIKKHHQNFLKREILLEI